MIVSLAWNWLVGANYSLLCTTLSFYPCITLIIISFPFFSSLLNLFLTLSLSLSLYLSFCFCVSVCLSVLYLIVRLLPLLECACRSKNAKKSIVFMLKPNIHSSRKVRFYTIYSRFAKSIFLHYSISTFDVYLYSKFFSPLLYLIFVWV